MHDFINALGRDQFLTVKPGNRQTMRASAVSRDFEPLVRTESTDFHNLAPAYEGQKTDASCSLASATMVLNALQRASGRTSRPRVSQQEVLDKVPGVTWERAVAQGSTGLTLDQLHTEVKSTLNAFDYPDHEVRAVHVTDTGPEKMAALKQDLIDNEASEKILIIANFDQGTIFGGDSSGHFAPVGKYDAATDRVLIMDPDRELFDPFWVPLDVFLKSMSGIDSDSGLARGYLVVKLK